MSTEIDEKVVEMRFDNRDFEQNVRTSMSTLDRLKTALHLGDTASELDQVGAAVKDIRMDGVVSAIGAVEAKFSAFSIMALDSLIRLKRAAEDYAISLAKSLSVEQINAGWSKYAEKTAAVQTIMAATSKNFDDTGAQMEFVSNQLDKLNWFTDETSYSFLDMVNNIGKFTSNNVDLETSVTAMEGISTWAAVSGANVNEAGRAMYNLSQAMAVGAVKLQDWKSIENANMATAEFKETVIETAIAEGTLIRSANGAIKTAKGVEVSIQNFNQSLSEGWFTSDVLLKTLDQYGSFTDKLHDSMEQIEGDITTSKLIDYVDQYKQGTLDMAEATKATGLSAELLKPMLEELGDDQYALGRKAFAAAQEAKTFREAIDSVKDAVSTGWMNTFELIFGNYEEAKKLWTNVANELWEVFAGSAEARNELLGEWKDKGGRDSFLNGIANAWRNLRNILDTVHEAFETVFPKVTSDQLVGLTNQFECFTEKMFLSEETLGKLKDAFQGLFSVLNIFKKIAVAVLDPIFKLTGSEGFGSLADMLLDVAAAVGRFFTSIDDGLDASGLGKIFESLGTGVSNLLKTLTSKLSEVRKIFPEIGNGLKNIVQVVWNYIKIAFSYIKDNFSIKDIFMGLVGGGILVSANKFIGMIKSVKDAIFGIFSGEKTDGIKKKFSDIMSSIHDSLQSFTTGIKLSSIVAIAIAVGILSSSVQKLSEISPGDIAKAMTAVGILMKMLGKNLESMAQTLSFFNAKGLISAGVAMVFIATAVKTLSNAIIKLAEVPFAQLLKGLFGVGVAILELTIGLKLINGVEIPFRTSVGLLALAESCKILSDALAKFGTMQWDEIGRGLTAMGGALVELVAAMVILGKFSGGGSIAGSIGILIVTQSLSKMADGLMKFGTMQWDEIGRGLTAMGGALAEVVAACTIAGRIGGFSTLFGAGAILIVIQGLDDLANALAKFGTMQWDEIGRGLTAMGGALAVIAGGSLINSLSILGSKSIATVAKPLGDLATSVRKWTNVVIPDGLFTQLSSLAAGIRSFTFDGFGADAISKVAEPLGTLANSVMQWDGISIPDDLGDGLTSLASGVGAFTFEGFGAGAIAKVAEPLGDLAVSIKKWTGVNVPSNLSTNLNNMADGIASFSSDFIAGASLAKAAEPVGQLADSVRKWIGVTVPTNIKNDLSNLADGVKSFSLAFVGGWSLSAVTNPLGELGTALKKWSGVSIPDDIGSKLSEFGLYLNGFASNISGIAEVNSSSIVSFATAIRQVVLAINKTSNIDTGSIDTFINAIHKIIGIDFGTGSFESGSTKVANGITSMVNAIDNFHTSMLTKVESISSVVQKMMADPSKWGFSEFKNNFSKIGTEAGNSLIEAIVSAVKSGDLNSKIIALFKGDNALKLDSILSDESDITSKFDEAATSGANAIKNHEGDYLSAGKSLVDSYARGIEGNASKIDTTVNKIGNAIKTALSGAVDAVSIGSNFTQGLANGISANVGAAIDAATAVGGSVVAAMQAALDIHSPSKIAMRIGEFFVQGFENGISSRQNNAANITKNMGNRIVDSLSGALQIANTVINSGLELSPKIAPILDLSEAKRNVDVLDTLVTKQRAVTVGMTASVGDVNSANIKHLSDLLTNLSKTNQNGVTNNYNIGGVTYDDGTNVASAVGSLIHAIKIERRT